MAQFCKISKDFSDGAILEVIFLESRSKLGHLGRRAVLPDWLVISVIGWLVGWSVGWLVNWSVGLVGCSWSVGWLVGWLVGQSVIW